MTEEMSFQVSLENCQGFSILDRGGKFIPPARNGEWKRSGNVIVVLLYYYTILLCYTIIIINVIIFHNITLLLYFWSRETYKLKKNLTDLKLLNGSASFF